MTPETPTALQHYSKGMRVVEVLSLLAFFGMSAYLVQRIPFSDVTLLQWASAYFLAAITADLLSGLVHWFADTWGSYKMPVFGPTLIRSFREHHVDPKSITRHDFIETNGATALVLLPLLVAFCFFPPHYIVLNVFFIVAAWLVFFTNQFHKWAHQDEISLPIRALQRLRIILPVSVHALHHAGDRTSGYCITTGWLNAPLHHIRFFRVSEWLITLVTGEQPRQEEAPLK